MRSAIGECKSAGWAMMGREAYFKSLCPRHHLILLNFHDEKEVFKILLKLNLEIQGKSLCRNMHEMKKIFHGVEGVHVEIPFTVRLNYSIFSFTFLYNLPNVNKMP